MGKNLAVGKRILFLILTLAIIFCLGFLPAETEMMSRAAWQYSGLLIGLLFAIVTGALADWMAGIIVCCFAVIFGIDSYTGLYNSFAGTQVWMIIAIYMFSTGVTNSGFLRRIALGLLQIFPKTWRGQILGFVCSSAILSPLLPSTVAKVGILTPLACEVGTEAGLEKHTKPFVALWGIGMIAGFYLSCAFISGSAQCAIMASFMGDGALKTWGQWFGASWIYWLGGLIILFIYGAFLAKPKEKVEIPKDFYKKMIDDLGPWQLKEKQGAIITAVALILWILEKKTGIAAIHIALFADAAFLFCGLLTNKEVSARGNWTMVIFVGTLIGFSGYMSKVGLSAALGKLLSPVLSPIMASPVLFIFLLCIVVILLRYVIVSQLAICAIMLAVFGPLMQERGMSLFVLIFVTHQCCGCWNLKFSNPVATGLIGIVGEDNITYKDSLPISYLYCVICIITFTLSAPLWHGMGLL